MATGARKAMRGTKDFILSSFVGLLEARVYVL